MLFMELREGRNRQIRRMLANLGYPVKKLRRVRMGPLALKGLSPGEWRELSRGELTALRRAAYRVRDTLKKDASPPSAAAKRDSS
jgi:16S rRNA U516 pseudouridylate synthase RsuA-like enzyme